jgi:hypothetical protein
LHVVVAPGLQTPLPSQVEASEVTLLLQLAGAHSVPDFGYTQAALFWPSHVAPHGPLPWHDGRPTSGGPVTAEHVPWRPGRLQAAHWPVQLSLQQYPSTQKADLQSPFEPQRSPLSSFLAPHTPLAQPVPLAQSVSLEQVVRHAIMPHWYTPHDEVSGAGQAPWPLQVAALVATLPVQLAMRQVVVLPG